MAAANSGDTPADRGATPQGDEDEVLVQRKLDERQRNTQKREEREKVNPAPATSFSSGGGKQRRRR
jgi:hypothetical protein